MSSVGSAVKQAFTSVTQSAKVADLQRDTIDPSSHNDLTTDHGVKVSDTDSWYVEIVPLIMTVTKFPLRLKVASGDSTGPSLLEDQIGREKIHRFDHERIPERVVHARGTAAHGYFKVYDDRASKYTSAPVLTDASRTTPLFIRFSTVQGSKGSAVCKQNFILYPELI